MGQAQAQAAAAAAAMTNTSALPFNTGVVGPKGSLPSQRSSYPSSQGGSGSNEVRFFPSSSSNSNPSPANQLSLAFASFLVPTLSVFRYAYHQVFQSTSFDLSSTKTQGC